MDNVALALHLAAYAHHRRAEDGSAVLVEDIGPHDEVGDVRFVLEGDEHHPLCAPRLLPEQHDSGELDIAPVLGGAECGATDHPAPGVKTGRASCRVRVGRYV